MLIGIIGESCTGKSTIANKLIKELDAKLYSGKDYLRMAKDEAVAKKMFTDLLNSAVNGENVIYVISEAEQLSLLPNETFRVLVTADIDTIKARFASRMHSNLPAPVAAMLDARHGCFDMLEHDFHVVSGAEDIDTVCEHIISAAKAAR